ncbi:MAG: bifunctional phosphoribosyl-AMP cyclohydrolase/phosphoribosyl-ATP diphosphatase HisIE [Gemmatimonadota bacterium]
MTDDRWLDLVRFGADGLVPVVAQEVDTGAVLMLAWANREALERTRATGDAHYFSRSRHALWKKGETSGYTQRVAEIRVDCDADTVLYRVHQTGPACHEGTVTCFSRAVTPAGDVAAAPDDPPGPAAAVLDRLAAVIARRAAERPQGSYTVRLLEQGVGKVAQKVGEEATEVVVAATTESGGRLASEAADLLYHLLVLLEARGVALGAVWQELERRGK